MDIEFQNKSLIGDSIEIYEDNAEDFVLVVGNPFDVGSYTCSEFTQEFESHEIQEIFKRLFKINENDPIMGESLQNLKNLESQNDKIRLKDVAKIIIESLLRVLQEYLGFVVKASFSGKKDQIFLLLRASEHNLKVQADIIDYKLQFNASSSDLPEGKPLPFMEVLPYAPFEKADGRSGPLITSLGKNPETLYKKYDKQGKESEEGNLFKYNDRIRLIYSMLTTTIEIGDLLNLRILKYLFPLHDNNSLKILKQDWANLKKIFKAQPIEKIKVYFGEEITLYFAWLEYYIKWLMIPAIFGTLVGIIIYSTGGIKKDSLFSSASLLVFSLLISISSTFMDQIWTRRENTLAWKWGLTDFHATEEQRPGFHGEYKKDEVSGKMKKIFEPTGLRKYSALLGYFVISLFILLVIGCLAAIFIYRNLTTWEYGPTLAGIMNAVQIKVLNFVMVT